MKFLSAFLCMFFTLQSSFAVEISFKSIEEELAKFTSKAEKLSYLTSRKTVLKQLTHIDQAKYWHAIGMVQDKNQQVDAALDSFTNAIEIHKQQQLPTSPLLVHSYLERSYMKYIQTYDAHYYCGDREKALALIDQIDEQELVVKVLVQNAFCFGNDVKKLKAGLALLNRAVDIAKQYNLSSNLYSMIYNASGSLYRKNQMMPQAYDFLIKAYENWKEIDDYSDMFNMQHTLVAISIDMLKFDLAKRHVEELFSLAKTQPQFEDFLFFSFYNAGLLAFNLDKYQEAIKQFNLALLQQDKTNEKHFVRLALKYNVIANFRLGNTEEAQQVFNEYLRQFPRKLDTENELLSIQAYFKHEYFDALIHLNKQLENEITTRRKFINQSSLAATELYNDNLTTLDNKILQQDLEINKLLLTQAKDGKQIAYLSLMLIVVFLIGLIFLVFYLMKTRKEFQTRAQTDYLTGIANRRYSLEQGETMLINCRKQNQPFSVMLFDIDYFKKVNDVLGHEAGDKALTLVAQKVLSVLREQDFIGRVGGEEFLIFLPNTQLTIAQEIAERVRIIVTDVILSNNVDKMPLSVSIGLTSIGAEESLKVAIARADKLLYEAKNAGRNCVKMSI